MTQDKIKLLLVDDDPIFRLGLSTALESFDDLQVVAQADTSVAAFERLAQLGDENAPDILIGDISDLQLCQQLKKAYPNLPIFLLSNSFLAQQLAALSALGVNGYCRKGTAIAVVVQALRQIAAGISYWQENPTQEAVSIAPSQLSVQVRPQKWLSAVRQSGIGQIETTLAEVRSHLQNPQLSQFDWLYWSGRERELLAARWCVNQLFPVEVVVIKEQPTQEQGNRQLEEIIGGELSPIIPAADFSLTKSPDQSPLAILFNSTLAKIQSGVKNLTSIPLEIDLLQAEKKQELLYLVLQKLGKVLEELRFLQVSPEDLIERRSLTLRDLWQTTTIDFFVKYYTTSTGITEYTIVDILVLNAGTIQEQILNKIPFVVELFAYLLFDKPLVINNVPYHKNAPEALARAELLLQNLIIGVANGVIQLLLNYFAELETVKYSLYDQPFLSSREIAQFRNNLSWRYRQEYYIEQPKAIFESQYRLFVLTGTGIRRIYIYAPRTAELNQLRGIRWAVTIALETRDALAPRLRAVVAFVGSGVVYLLTQVIGRGIGLIFRGIIQGIGNTLQEVRYGKKNNSERGKKISEKPRQ